MNIFSNHMNVFIKKYSVMLILALILILGVFFRIYQLNSVPSSLFRDEVSIGYNAYSLMTTLKDEHGSFLPLSFQAIGDWKLPVYIYATIPFIKIVGLQDITPRLPAVVAGILSIILIYFLTLYFFKNKKIALLSAFFLAVSPWHIFASRIAYEPTLGLAFILLGACLFFYSTKNKQYLIWSALSFGLSFFTYHGDQIFTLLFIISLILFGKKIWDKNKKFAAMSLLLVFFLGLIAAKATLLQSDVIKISGIGFFTDKSFNYYAIERKRTEHGASMNSFLVKTWHSKFTAFPFKLGENYLKAFSTQFLFEKGSENPWQNMEEMGYFYIIDALFILIGLLVMAARKEVSLRYVLAWLLIAPIPGSITRDAPGASRTLTLVIPLIITISYGVHATYSYMFSKKRVVKILGVSVVSLLYMYSILTFLEFYFVHFPINRAVFYGYGYKQEALIAQKSSARKVIVNGLYEYNYPYFLYYLGYPADKFRKEVVHAPLTADNFLPVTQFGRYYFVDAIDWEKVCSVDLGSLVFTDYVKFPIGMKPDGIISLPGGQPRFAYVTTSTAKCSTINTKQVVFPINL